MEQQDSSDEVIARGERWAPLGAAEPEDAESTFDFDDQDIYWQSYSGNESEKLRLLEEDQEQLNSSLMALTSHFAQVQFRLKQIVDADPESKEVLLKELEEFAFRGIPDFQNPMRNVEGEQFIEEDHASKMESHRLKQHQLIEQLKQQLEDLERYAYETGEAGLPQTQVVERQKIIIDQMKSKLQFNVDDLDKYTIEELRQQVDQAIGQLVNPLKMKEQLVSQLKTQITDLERFIEFLQGPAETQQEHCRNCAKTGKHPFCKPSSSRVGGDKGSGKPLQLNEKNDKVSQVFRRITNLLQIYIISQFGCGVSTRFTRDMPAKEGNKQLRDALSRLNGAVLHVMRSASNHDNSPASSKTALVGATWQPDVQIEIVKAVRKGLCPALRDLLSHGMLNQGSTSLVPFFSCAVPRSAGIPAAASSSAGCSPPHPWQIFVAFYTTKDGKSVMSNPQRSLAQSFSLEIQGGTSKQGLLMAIGNIIAMHRPYKRGPEAHFKAFLSSALNAKKIVPWLRIILRSPSLLDEFYEPWAFAVQPGFDDIWRVLEPLQSVNFQLPEDLSIRSLRNISDAF